MTTTYIYHVIGTLTWDHIKNSLESIARQNFRWQRFILFNHSEWKTEDIFAEWTKLGLYKKFLTAQVHEIPADIPPTSTADWSEQMEYIDGTDRYLSHKADFYLADGVCEALDSLESNDWFLLFSKFDMKETVTLETLREFASRSWDKNISLPNIGRYPSPHIGRLAIPFDGIDGTMHAYTDNIREQYNPSSVEREMRWGYAGSIRDLASRVPLIKDNRFYALHMWHDTPHRGDPIKSIPGERF